jgi:two-component system, chemotaxis family, chemotaxis protein CheY
VANGVEALDVLATRPIDLVMLDISMPVMRGDDMLERLREDPTHHGLPVVVVSSERSGERVARMQELGAAFVKKPFAPEEIRGVLLNLGLCDAVHAE